VLAGLAGGVLFVTGDHGCDPTTPPTDHSRELVPMLAAGLPGGPYDVGQRSTFADLGSTVAEVLGVDHADLAGESFARRIGLG
jgi:phosphopentomutase